MRFPVRDAASSRRGTSLLAVDDVSLSIRRGETLGLVGESGSGKSTLARLVLRLMTPTAGVVHFDGQDIGATGKSELRALRRRMQIVFQDPFSSLDPRMSIGAIVAEGIAGVARNARERRVAELLDRVGLPAGFASRHPHQLSGGQRQRVGIARALAVEPEFLVLDEPVSALDVSVQSQVLNVLLELQADLHLTYLFISHDLGVVHHVADRIAVMYLGKIVEIMPADDIFDRHRHPYTHALLSAMPTFDELDRRERVVLVGDMPTPIDTPPGCRFAARCFQPLERCAEELPPLAPIEREHVAACFNPVNAAPRTSAASADEGSLGS
jgi:oligopeptide/dipeptide ABC transporter ATP-binding protein